MQCEELSDPLTVSSACHFCLLLGALFILSVVLRPILPILAPGHISGALAVVISLRCVSDLQPVNLYQVQVYTRSVRLIDALKRPQCITLVSALLVAYVMKVTFPAPDMQLLPPVPAPQPAGNLRLCCVLREAGISPSSG